MATHTFTTLELHSYLQSFLLTVRDYDRQAWYFLMDMYNMGIRWVERYEITRWSTSDDITYILDTAKNSNNRTFNVSRLSIQLTGHISTSQDFDLYGRYNKIAKQFNHFFAYPDIYLGSKRVSAHIFRYHYAKYLKYQGHTDSEIKTDLGEVDQANADLYIYGDLKTDNW